MAISAEIASAVAGFLWHTEGPTWKKRWFFLDVTNSISFDRSEYPGGEVVGRIPFSELTSVKLAPESSSPHNGQCAFYVQCGDDTHLLAAPTPSEAEQWVAQLSVIGEMVRESNNLDDTDQEGKLAPPVDDSDLITFDDQPAAVAHAGQTQEDSAATPQISALQAQIADLQAQLIASQTERAGAQTRADAAERQLAASREAAVDLESSLRIQQMKASEFQKQNNQLRAELESLAVARRQRGDAATAEDSLETSSQSDAAAALASINAELANAKECAKQRQDELESAKQTLARQAQQLADMNQRVDAQSRALEAAAVAQEGVAGTEAGAVATLQGDDTTVQSLRAELAAAANTALQHQTDLAGARKEAAEHFAALEAAKESTLQQQERADVAESMVQSLEGALLLEQNKVKECDKQLEDAMHNLDLVRQDKERGERACEELRCQVSTAHESNAHLQQQLENITAKSFADQERAEIAEGTKANLQDDLDKLQEKYKQAETEQQQLQMRVKELSQSAASHNMLSSQFTVGLQSAKAETAEEYKKRVALEQQVQSLTEDVHTLRTQNSASLNDLSQELTTANSRLEDALKEVASALARADRAEAAVEEFCVTSKRMQAELDQANERMLAASDAKAGLVAQMAEAEDEVRVLRAQALEAEERHSAAQAQIRELQSQITDLHLRATELEEVLQKEQSAGLALQELLDSQQQTAATMQENLETSLAQANDRTKAMAIDIEMLQQELDASIHQHQAKVGMVSKAEKARVALEEAVARTEQRNLELRKQNEVLQKRLDTLSYDTGDDVGDAGFGCQACFPCFFRNRRIRRVSMRELSAPLIQQWSNDELPATRHTEMPMADLAGL